MSEREQLYKSLPDSFSPKQMQDIVNDLNVKEWMKSRNWIQSVLDSWLFDSKIERIGRGIYSKLNDRGT